MATWKKVIVSGSVAELSASLYRSAGQSPQQITNLASTTILSGSFSGSFYGTFNGASSGGSTLEATVFNQSAGQTWESGYFPVVSGSEPEIEGTWKTGTTSVSTAIADLNALISTLIQITDSDPLSQAGVTAIPTYLTSPAGVSATANASSVKLSFGADQTHGSATNNYYAVKRATAGTTYFDSGDTDINLNSTYTSDGAGNTATPTTSTSKSGLAYHLSSQTLTFDLLGKAAAIAGTTGTSLTNTVRYLHTGSLLVYINDTATPIATFDLSALTTNGSSTSGNVTFFHGAPDNAVIANSTTPASGETHKFRLKNTSKSYNQVSISNSAFRNGWNWVSIKHDRPTGDTDYLVKAFEFIYHVDTNAMSIANSTYIASSADAYQNLSFNGSTYYYLSGVKYWDGSNTTVTPLTSSITVSNAYKMVHPSSITFSDGTSGVTTVASNYTSGSKSSNAYENASSATTIPPLNGAVVTPYDSDLYVAVRDTFLLSGYTNFVGYKAADTLKGNKINVAHPFKPTTISTQFSTGSFYLANVNPTSVTNNNSTVEYFINESWRLPSTYDYSTNASTLRSISSPAAWNSQVSLVDGGTSGYNNSVLVEPNNLSQTITSNTGYGILRYPTKAGANSNGSFISALGPHSQVDYQSANVTGVRYFYRNFYANVGASANSLVFSAKGSATLVSGTPSTGTNQIKVQFTIPGYLTTWGDGNDGWFDLLGSTDYTETGQTGKLFRKYPETSFGGANITVDSSGLNYTFSGASKKSILFTNDSFGGGILPWASLISGMSIVMKITIPQGWTGYLNAVSMGFLQGTPACTTAIIGDGTTSGGTIANPS